MIATTIMSSISVKPRWWLAADARTGPDKGFMAAIRIVAGFGPALLLPHGAGLHRCLLGLELSPFGDRMSAAVITGKSVICVPLYARSQRNKTVLRPGISTVCFPSGRKKRTFSRRPFPEFGSPTRTRTTDILINSQTLYQLSYRGISRHPVAMLSGAGRHFCPAPARSQAARTRFMRLMASSSMSMEQANDRRK